MVDGNQYFRGTGCPHLQGRTVRLQYRKQFANVILKKCDYLMNKHSWLRITDSINSVGCRTNAQSTSLNINVEKYMHLLSEEMLRLLLLD
jgi:hypothetical protein